MEIVIGGFVVREVLGTFLYGDIRSTDLPALDDLNGTTCGCHHSLGGWTAQHVGDSETPSGPH
ncbi:MAG: hypothetical protein KGJ40_09245 [candidate division NC10 bacterium]|nr:hypothetical protein [candidate division NC10 bacterium]MDE2484320.1 hypothetical protein [candidate division NC10 bacterium]